MLFMATEAVQKTFNAAPERCMVISIQKCFSQNKALPSYYKFDPSLKVKLGKIDIQSKSSEVAHTTESFQRNDLKAFYVCETKTGSKMEKKIKSDNRCTKFDL